VTLWQTPALPVHYVAVSSTGRRWIVPVEPVGPEVWNARRPYRGRHKLTAVPDCTARMYRTYHWREE
jgi:hypothetical protein